MGFKRTFTSYLSVLLYCDIQQNRFNIYFSFFLFYFTFCLGFYMSTTFTKYCHWVNNFLRLRPRLDTRRQTQGKSFLLICNNYSRVQAENANSIIYI
ncbi:hypothetical protein GDO78_004216 [Eleutherodactylus coqui]|uniref:Uncharacterized protein n=1 Tax=Eleutherodactylus coqui TaxID=57060 RepID=A0A8J6ERP4_ELECQ|nr:hypothetical protein GDO78_004216 [Eleutherodactylus coqui]